jgi:hypothetical protein
VSYYFYSQINTGRDDFIPIQRKPLYSTAKCAKNTKTSVFRAFRIFRGLYFGCGFAAPGLSRCSRLNEAVSSLHVIQFLSPGRENADFSFSFPTFLDTLRLYIEMEGHLDFRPASPKTVLPEKHPAQPREKTSPGDACLPTGARKK